MRKNGMSKAVALKVKDKLTQALERLPEEAVVISASIGAISVDGPEVYIHLASGVAQAAAAFGDPPVHTVNTGTFISNVFTVDGVRVVQDVK